MRKKTVLASAGNGGKRPVRAKKAAQAKKVAHCVVCGGEVAPFSTEELCWVCRRLKISAWRDVESQSAMQE